MKEFEKDYVIFDLETTGLSTTDDSVVEISAIKVENGVAVDEFSTLVNPQKHIPDLVSSIHGITDEMVKDAPVMRDALKDFIDFIGDYVLVGHNIKRFDLGFIQRDAERYFGSRLSNDVVDTLCISNKYLPGLTSHSLGALAEHYGVSYEGAHRALVDCNINKQVYDCLAREAKNPSEAAKNVPLCPLCGNVLKKRCGKHGEFWGCMGYPDCTYTKNE